MRGLSFRYAVYGYWYATADFELTTRSSSQPAAVGSGFLLTVSATFDWHPGKSFRFNTTILLRKTGFHGRAGPPHTGTFAFGGLSLSWAYGFLNNLPIREKILLVDDGPPTVRAIPALFLRKWGYEIVEGRRRTTKRWTILSRESIGLVISDWVMPRFHGRGTLPEDSRTEFRSLQPTSSLCNIKRRESGT